MNYLNCTGALPYFIELTNALMTAEKEGLKYHGDIKPANIIVSSGGQIKILDPSSMSHSIPRSPLSDISSQSPQITTPIYNPFLECNDLGSLGVMLYEVSTGFLPFSHNLLDLDSLALSSREIAMLSNFINPLQLNPNLPEILPDIILKSLHLKEEGNRFFRSDEGYKSLSELKKDLEKLMAEGQTFLKMPSRDKKEAIMRSISPYLVKEKNPLDLNKILSFIINYQPVELSSTIGIVTPSIEKEITKPGIGKQLKSENIFERGKLLLNRYKILQLISENGLTFNYLAYDQQENMKIRVSSPGTDNDDCMRIFKRSAKLWLKIPGHKNLVRAISLQEINGLPLLFLEQIEGKDLSHLLKEKKLGVLQALDIAVQICEGMEHLWKTMRLIHRDLKPGNIIVGDDGIVRIADFELIKVVEDQGISDKNKDGICGTPLYMSPEQCKGDMRIDTRSDIYSFGIVLFEMICGRRPFDVSYSPPLLLFQHQTETPPAPVSLRGDCPRLLNDLILKCLEKKPEDRYQDFGEIKEKLIEIKPIIKQTEDGKINSLETFSEPRPLRTNEISIVKGVKFDEPQLQWSSEGDVIYYLVDASVHIHDFYPTFRKNKDGLWHCSWCKLTLTEDEMKGNVIQRINFSEKQHLSAPHGPTIVATGVIKGSTYHLLPDGKSISFVSRAGKEVWVVDISNHETRRIKGEKDVVYQNIHWSPSAEYTAIGGMFGARGEKENAFVQIIRAQDFKECGRYKDISFFHRAGLVSADFGFAQSPSANNYGIGDNYDPTIQWSPDSTKILFTQKKSAQINAAEVTGLVRTLPKKEYREPDIWMINPEKQEARYLTNGHSPSWSPDSKKISFVRGNEIIGLRVE
ncbi:MAG: protein kinase [bacterium]